MLLLLLLFVTICYHFDKMLTSLNDIFSIADQQLMSKNAFFILLLFATFCYHLLPSESLRCLRFSPDFHDFRPQILGAKSRLQNPPHEFSVFSKSSPQRRPKVKKNTFFNPVCNSGFSGPNLSEISEKGYRIKGVNFFGLFF